ncbi:RES family NAD+ phosphorylase [Pseudomonas sp. DWRC2-2]|uniref:RES family NAD+ phosphorylase n=1 Tax=Pseudomonas sp. DWRC2-2 TaxID=2804567 RepID=UPI003CF4569E
MEKFICYKCVIESYLECQIKSEGSSMLCALCGIKRRCLPFSNISDMVKTVLDGYICEGDYYRRFGQDRSQDGEDPEFWVSEVLCCDNEEPIVQAICNDLEGYSYSGDTNYVRKPFLPDSIGRQWVEFQEGMLHGNRFFNDGARKFLGWLFDGLDSYSSSIQESAVVRLLAPDTSPPIFRARPCASSEEIDSISADPDRNLGAPPKEKARDGRMNPVGVPAFYGAFERNTCVAELRPPVGSDVISGEFRINGALRVLDFGRFAEADLGAHPSFFEPNYFLKAGRREFLRVLHDQITVPVLPGSGRSYLITQVIAEYLATQHCPRFDGVIFKSVQKPGGQNIVLFSHVASREASIVQPSNGGYMVLGPKETLGTQIAFVPGSLVIHTITGVHYEQDDFALRA